MTFISRISRAKQNREIKGREYQLQAKIGQNYYSILNCMVLVRQNKGAKIILHAESPTFWAAKLKGFTMYGVIYLTDAVSSCVCLLMTVVCIASFITLHYIEIFKEGGLSKNC